MMRIVVEFLSGELVVKDGPEYDGRSRVGEIVQLVDPRLIQNLARSLSP
jgi:hypothetical protein